MKKKTGSFLLGGIAGILNGLFGAGGGLVVVPLLEKLGLKPQKAHATSIAIILPLSVISALLYLWQGNIDIMKTLWYLPGGIAGAVFGTFLLKRVPNGLLRRIFGAVIIISAARLLLK